MTDTALVDDRLTRLESLVARMEQLGGIDLSSIMPTSVNPDGTPGPVAAGELIESAWGNAVQQTLMLRRGVGLNTPSQSIQPGTNPLIAWTAEAYDTDNYHVPNSTDIVIPTNRPGVYGISLNMTTTGAVSANSLVRLLLPGGAIRQSIIVTGQSIGSVSYIGPLSVGQIVQASFWNAGAGAVFVGCAIELLRVAM